MLMRRPISLGRAVFVRVNLSYTMVSCLVVLGILFVTVEIKDTQRDLLNTAPTEDRDNTGPGIETRVTNYSRNINVTIERTTKTRVYKIFSDSTSVYTPNIKYPLTVLDDPYHINNEHICIDNLSFVVVVHSSTTHFNRRRSMRETWANYKLFRNQRMRIVFLLGMPEKESTQVLIKNESLVYGDIVQGRFQDSYHNLTHKAVLGIRWVSEFCSHVRLVVKVDDDVFLNVFKLFDDIENKVYTNRSKEMWCSVRHKGTSVIQRKTGKWKMDDSEFKNMTHFPVTYCNGFFAIITGDLISEMYAAAKNTPFFWVDDIYLFGLLTDKIEHVTFTHLWNLNLYEQIGMECFESREKNCDLLVASTTTDGVMNKLWYLALQQFKELAKRYTKDGVLE